MTIHSITLAIQALIKRYCLYAIIAVVALVSLFYCLSYFLFGVDVSPLPFLFTLLIGTLIATGIIVGLAYGIYRGVIKKLATLTPLDQWVIESNKHQYFEKLADSNELFSAINKLITQLNQAKNNDSRLAQRIRQQHLVDEQTNIGNREFFTNRLAAFLAEEDARGTLLLIQAQELEQVELQYGENHALLLLNTVIQTIKKRIQAKTNYFLARRDKYELALLLPNAFVDETEKLATTLMKSLSLIELPSDINQEEFIHIGISCFRAPQQSYQILAEADMALRTAQLHGPSQWFMFERNEIVHEYAKGSLKWRTFLEKVIKDDAIMIFFQPVVSSDGKHIVHHEVLAKIKDQQNNLLSARVFLPMAQKCGLIKNIDLLVFARVCKTLAIENNHAIDFSLNFSVESLLSKDFLTDFHQIIDQYPTVTKHLIIEVSEYHLASQLDELTPILMQLQQLGVRLLVDKVGQYLVNLQYLKVLTVSYLKLDSSIVLDIDKKIENQVFISSLSILCKEHDVACYALGVETKAEWQTLLKLGVNGGQGHYFIAPQQQVVRSTVELE